METAIAPICEAGQVWLPKGAPWLSTWASQFDPFPRGRNDDLVDALSQGLGWLVSQRSVGTRDGVVWGRAR